MPWALSLSSIVAIYSTELINLSRSFHQPSRERGFNWYLYCKQYGAFPAGLTHRLRAATRPATLEIQGGPALGYRVFHRLQLLLKKKGGKPKTKSWAVTYCCCYCANAIQSLGCNNKYSHWKVWVRPSPPFFLEVVPDPWWKADNVYVFICKQVTIRNVYIAKPNRTLISAIHNFTFHDSFVTKCSACKLCSHRSLWSLPRGLLAQFPERDRTPAKREKTTTEEQ